ncbi:AraC-type DNA-binding protein [Parapedobacter luteus]|uniref:AraC-type DNA-binding protein n=1 Tax=Parapedobacter luteus TaxID=623280 RepID=A0A1T5CAS9_9SPHI|nr:AraC family transcriptional regulator [Parapedobacter luteus]SKB56652.1 AraC-type DNA-binding protein [Parapedobacter luteus]
MNRKNTLRPLPLSSQRELRTLVENRRAYTLNSCELNVFETYKRSELVPLQFDDLVITSMLRGKKVMHLFGKPGFDYLPGETVIVPPSVRMEIDFPLASDNEPTQCTALAIGRKQIADTINYLNEYHPRSLGALNWQLTFDKYHFYNHTELAVLINKLIAISTSGDVHKDVLADLTLKELLIRIIQLQNRYTATDATQPDSRIGQVVAYIRQHIAHSLSVDELSQVAHISKPHFYRAFKHEMGISPMEFVILERINQAKQLLAAGSTIKEACFGSGFNNLNYFIRIFKKHEGITPGAYRLLLTK